MSSAAPSFVRSRFPATPRVLAPAPDALRVGATIFLVLAHIPLALAMYGSNAIATLHAIVALGAALGCALFEKRRERVLYAAAYIVGAEVLWRMCRSTIPWEFGKYAITVTMMAAIFRDRRRLPTQPLLYAAFLCIGIVSTLVDLGVNEAARQTISFNLSGPLALFICAWYCSGSKVTTVQLQKLMMALAAPLVGMAAVTRYSTVQHLSTIKFNTESNFGTSGGFGPNQVATTLALGALAFFFVQILRRRIDWTLTLFLLLGACFLLMQSALTFSRSGLYNFAGAFLLALFFLMRSKRARFQLLAIAVPLLLIGNFLVLPYVEQLTGGKLLRRFQSIDTSHRGLIVMGDLKVWQDNPIFGVGVGMSRGLHFKGASVAAHTEFSRMLSEHGSFGFAALLVLLAMCYANVRRQTTPPAKAIIAALVVWSLLFMSNSAMRIAAPSFLLGLCCVSLMREEQAAGSEAPSSSKRRDRRLPRAGATGAIHAPQKVPPKLRPPGRQMWHARRSQSSPLR